MQILQNKTLVGAGLLKVALQLCYFGFALAALGAQTQPTTLEEDLLLSDPIDNVSVQALGASGGFGALLQAIVALLFVLGLVYATLIVLRKLSGKEAKNSSNIKVLDTQTIKAGAHLSIVEIAGRLFVLGIAESITPITEINDQEQIDQLKLQFAQREDQPNQRFVQLLKDRMRPSQTTSPTTQPSAIKSNKDFLKDYTSRLTPPTTSTQKDVTDDE